MFNLDFPVELKRAKGGGYVVTFPDVPEAITEGDDEDEALLRAVDALETALEMYADDGEDLPQPSKLKRGRKVVRPSALASIKLAVYQSMRDEGVRKSELARRLGWHLPQVDRLLDLHHASRLDQAKAALLALGRRLEVRAI
jgi:antitoxin HicB